MGVLPRATILSISFIPIDNNNKNLIINTKISSIVRVCFGTYLTIQNQSYGNILMMTKHSAVFEKQPFVILITILSILFIIGGAFYYKYQADLIRDKNHRMLLTTGEIKTSQLTHWYEDELYDASVFARNPIFQNFIGEWLTTERASAKSNLVNLLNLTGDSHSYENILITDPNGSVLLSLKPEVVEIDSLVIKYIREAVQSRDIISTDLYESTLFRQIFIDFLAPVVDERNEPLVVIILRIDPHEYLYPFIESWPVQTETAESYIFRREGDSVLFLNELRHQPKTGMKLRYPLSRNDLPAVQAVLGFEGIYSGKDHRGVEMLADVRSVPGTPWHLVAKIDKDEVYSELYFRAGRIIAFVLVLIFLSGVGMALIYTNRQRNIYHELYTKEKELWESQEEFRTTLYSIGDAVITTDTAGTIRTMNPTAERLTGWSERGARGKSLEVVFRIINEETGSSIDNPVRKVLQKDDVIGLANHTILISKEGREIPIADSGAPIRNEKGEVIGVVLVFRDQTAEREAARKLLESERRLATLMSNLPGMAYRCQNDPQWTMEFVSKGCLELTGYSHEELTGNRVVAYSDLIHEDDRQMVWDVVQTTLKSNRPFTLTYRIRTADGREKWVWEQGSGIYSETRDLIALEGFITDITERKEGEESLRRREQQFRLIAETVPDMIVVLDTEGRRLYSSPSFGPILGDPDALFGTDSFKDIHPDDRERIRQVFKETIRTGVGQHAEYRLMAKDGTIRIIESKGGVIRDDEGNATQVVVVSRDVTEKRKFEQQLLRTQRMESIGTLAGGIAHDLNNVLSPILLAVQVIKKSASEKKAEKFLDTIEISAKRGADLVNQVLSFAKGVEGERKPIQIGKLIHDVCDVIKRTFPKSISVKIDTQQDVWTLSGDATQVHQILMNLCINARDAMPKGGTLEIKTVNIVIDEQYARMNLDATPGSFVKVSVSDSGTGIPERVIDKIFEPFFTTKEEGKGTGLGLSTVHTIVKSHGGFVNIYSEEGKGTVFNVYLPAPESEVETIVKDKKEIPTGNGELILVVDDEKSVRAITQATLEANGYRVITATDGIEAVTMYSEHMQDIALVLMDLRMPNMDGHAAIRAIKELSPNVKCIAMSGMGRDGKSKKKDFVGLLRKPLTAETLLSAIYKMLLTKK
jgi:two-component system, cell cycle sensor histidine kinase and response regulator CckA